MTGARRTATSAEDAAALTRVYARLNGMHTVEQSAYKRKTESLPNCKPCDLAYFKYLFQYH